MNANINLRTFNRRHDDRGSATGNGPVVQHPYPSRDFGVGYGRSSGYAAVRRYTARTFTPMYARA